MTIITSLIALSFTLLLVTPNVADRCDCGGSPSPTVCESYSAADAVFVGVVRKVERHEPKKNGKSNEIFSGQIAHVQVERVFKGEDISEAIFRSGKTPCDPSYEVGKRWLFYAYYDEESRTWSVNGCGRSTFIQFAADDLQYLQGLPASAQKTRISGVLELSGIDQATGNFLVEYLSGVRVKVSDGQKTYEVLTDGNGVYEIYGLPPGRYAIQPEIPPGLKISFPNYHGERDDSDKNALKAVLGEKGCAGADFYFIGDAAINGKLFGADGRAMPKVCLSLQPKGMTAEHNWFYDCTDEQGRYEFREIPPGDYTIVVNNGGKISSDAPFPKAYYPGVFDKERAGVLSMAGGDRLENVNIHIPSQEIRNVIQGVLLRSGGRPAADVVVTFEAEAAPEGYIGKVHTRTDAHGRFSLNVLQGLKGRIYGHMDANPDEYPDCPELEKLIKAKGGYYLNVETKPIHLKVTTDVEGVKLIFPELCKGKTRVKGASRLGARAKGSPVSRRPLHH